MARSSRALARAALSIARQKSTAHRASQADCRSCLALPKLNDNLVRSLRPAQALITWIERAEAATRARDYDTLESLLIKLLRDLKQNTQKGSGFFAESVPREQVVAPATQLLANLELPGRRRRRSRHHAAR